MSPNTDEPNTDEAAETQVGPANDGTDIVVSDATQLAALAWSHDEPEPEPQAHQHRWATAWALAAIFLVCGTVMGVSIWAMSQHRTAPPTAAVSVTPTPSATPTPPAPPVVATVTAPPVRVTASPTAMPAPPTVPSSVTPSLSLSSTDRQFLTVLRNMGLGYPSPDYAIAHAHATCNYMTTHHVKAGGAEAANYVAATTVWTGNAGMFADYSAVNYCPHYASESE